MIVLFVVELVVVVVFKISLRDRWLVDLPTVSPLERKLEAGNDFI